VTDWLDFWWYLFIARQRLHVLMDVAVLAKYLSKFKQRMEDYKFIVQDQ
jgi:hypothetical protein